MTYTRPEADRFRTGRMTRYDRPVKQYFRRFCLDMGLEEDQFFIDDAQQEQKRSYNGDAEVAGSVISLEIKDTRWEDPLSFPFSTVRIPLRKSANRWHEPHVCKRNEKIAIFLLFHVDGQSFISVERADYDASPWKKYNTEDGESHLVDVPRSQCTFYAVLDGIWKKCSGKDYGNWTPVRINGQIPKMRKQ